MPHVALLQSTFPTDTLTLNRGRYLRHRRKCTNLRPSVEVPLPPTEEKGKQSFSSSALAWKVYGLEGHATGASASRTRLRISPPPPSSADTRVQAHACVPGAAFRWARRARDSALTRRARHHDLFPYVPLKEDKAGKIVPTPNYLGILNFLHSLWLPPPLLTLMPVQGPARFSPL